MTSAQMVWTQAAVRGVLSGPDFIDKFYLNDPRTEKLNKTGAYKMILSFGGGGAANEYTWHASKERQETKIKQFLFYNSVG